MASDWKRKRISKCPDPLKYILVFCEGTEENTRNSSETLGPRQDPSRVLLQLEVIEGNLNNDWFCSF